MITKKKWSTELVIEVEKCKRQEVKSAFDSIPATGAKRDCIKKAYSHKILRYLLFKIQKDNVREINSKLPYLNFSIVTEALNIVKK